MGVFKYLLRGSGIPRLTSYAETGSSRLSPQHVFVWRQNEKLMSLPKKKKKKIFFFFFFRETPTSPLVPFSAKFWPLE